MTYPGTMLFSRFKYLRVLSLIIDNHASSKFCGTLKTPSRYLFMQSSESINTNILKYNANYIGKRYRYKKTKQDSDDEDDSSDDEANDKNLVTGYVPSLRADAVLKAGLGLSRNKIETSFYESKLRINGTKIMKKSQKVNIGDEVDLIKTEDTEDKDIIVVSRVIVESAKVADDGERLAIKMRRFKSLTIENYDK